MAIDPGRDLAPLKHPISRKLRDERTCGERVADTIDALVKHETDLIRKVDVVQTRRHHDPDSMD